MKRLSLIAAALLSLSACGPHFYGLRLHTVQRELPDIPIPHTHRAANIGWQGVFVELRSDQSFRAHVARHSISFGWVASLCDSADTTIATLQRWNNVSMTRAWDIAGELEQHIQIADAPAPYRYWLGLHTVTRTSRGRDLSPNPSFEFVDHDLRTSTRGVCMHASGFGWLRGNWHTNVVFIPAETLREALRKGTR